MRLFIAFALGILVYWLAGTEPVMIYGVWFRECFPTRCWPFDVFLLGSSVYGLFVLGIAVLGLIVLGAVLLVRWGRVDRRGT